jgi:hypothetical protein
MIADGEVEDGLAEVDRGFGLCEDQTTPPVIWPPLLRVRGHRPDAGGADRPGVGACRRVESLIPATDTQAPDLAIMRGDLHMAMAPPDGATTKRATKAPLTSPTSAVACAWPTCKRRRGWRPRPASRSHCSNCAMSTTHSRRATTPCSSRSSHRSRGTVGVTLKCGTWQLRVDEDGGQDGREPTPSPSSGVRSPHRLLAVPTDILG